MQVQEEKQYIRLAAFTFDPLEEAPVLPRNLRSTSKRRGSAYYIVQLHRSLTQEERERIQAQYGLRLTDYIPDHAYLERVSPQTMEALASEPLFRVAVPYHPAFRLEPGIGSREFVSESRRVEPGILLMVIAFEGASRKRLVAAVQKLGFEVVGVIDEPDVGILRLKVRVNSTEDASKLASLANVRYIEELGDVTLNNATTSWVIQTNVNNSRTIWDHGLRGEGQIIGHIDGALDVAHCFFRDVGNNTPRPAHRKVVAVRNAAGGARDQAHGTFSAGCAAGEDVDNGAFSAAPNPNNGNAPCARLTHGYLYDLGVAASFHSYLYQAHQDGAYIHSNSWDDKTTSAYTQLSVDLDRFTWDVEDDLVIIGPDNAGTIRPPDTSKNALVINATLQHPNQHDFSSGIRMFSLDGRRKPDLMAPGSSVTSADSGTQCGTRVDGGTSFAAPAVAGAAALVRQYYTEGWYPTGTRQPHHAFAPSGALLKATLLNATVDATGIAGYPGTANTGEGWGRLLLENALYFEGDARDLRVWDSRHADGITAGLTRTHHIDVATNTQQLKVTLVWTEPPGAANSATPVVNNLDLEVVSPDGAQTFRGNVFANGVSVTGGTADTLNNVEMVVVNNPAPGDWIIRVIGTSVNVGKPGQGYALVATADLTEPPVATGVQDTLVVRVRFADLALESSLPNLQNLMAEVADYISEVSYGQASIVPAFRGPLTLDHNRDYYYHPDRNLLIELTEEVVAKLAGAEPTLFDNLERMIIVTNDINFTGDWATTGPWPYSMPAGFTRPISVSIQSCASPAARFTHGMLHQFGLVDLYAHEGVVFPRPYVDEWDNMGGLYNNVHPLVWSKERAGWLTAHGDTIHYIPRPAAGASYSGLIPIPIFCNTSTVVNRKAIAIGLSQGAATLSAENIFYYVEARSNAPGTYDEGLPGSGVLIYYVNEMIAQGEGPVMLRDKNLLTTGLGDACFGVGDVIAIPGTGITITVQAGSGGADYNIHVAYTAPVTDYNVFITRGDTVDGEFLNWFSPDIWVDSPRHGFNLGGGPPPHDQREHPVAGVINRIYARVHNAGPATAYDFDVQFRISEPYHTVGGEADFDKFVGITHVTNLAAGAHRDVFVEWTPRTGEDPHACVRVDLINLIGTDTNPHDNWAQENLDIAASVTGSPFKPVTYFYNLTNPYDRPALFYFRAEGVPSRWKVEFQPRQIRLNPSERMSGQAIVTPAADADLCTSQRIQITTWTPRGDTMIRVGGGIAQVDLRRPAAVTAEAYLAGCKEPVEPLDDAERSPGNCVRVVAEGCLKPPLPGQEIILKYVSYEGEVTYRAVQTDANGCYEDVMVTVPENGRQTVCVEFPGGTCYAPVTAPNVEAVWYPRLLVNSFGPLASHALLLEAFLMAVPWRVVLGEAYPGRDIPLRIDPFSQFSDYYYPPPLVHDARTLEYNPDRALSLFTSLPGSLHLLPMLPDLPSEHLWVASGPNDSWPWNRNLFILASSVVNHLAWLGLRARLEPFFTLDHLAQQLALSCPAGEGPLAAFIYPFPWNYRWD